MNYYNCRNRSILRAMKHLLVFMFLALPAFAEQHFFYLRPVPASNLIGLGLPSSEAAKDTLQVNVRVQNAASFRIRTFITLRSPNGKIYTLERDTRLTPGDLWAAAYFQVDDVINQELIRIRFKEEPEPDALAESTIEVQR